MVICILHGVRPVLLETIMHNLVVHHKKNRKQKNNSESQIEWEKKYEIRDRSMSDGVDFTLLIFYGVFM